MFRPDELLIVITLLFPPGSNQTADQQFRIEIKIIISASGQTVPTSPEIPYRFPAPRKPDCR
jgi:hypothetical protein